MDAVADELPPGARVAYEGPDWLSVRKASRLVGVTPRTIYLWLRAGKLDAAYLPSGVMRVRVGSLLSTNDAERIARSNRRKQQLRATRRRVPVPGGGVQFVSSAVADAHASNAAAAAQPAEIGVGTVGTIAEPAPEPALTRALEQIRRVPVKRHVPIGRPLIGVGRRTS